MNVPFKLFLPKVLKKPPEPSVSSMTLVFLLISAASAPFDTRAAPANTQAMAAARKACFVVANADTPLILLFIDDLEGWQMPEHPRVDKNSITKSYHKNSQFITLNIINNYLMETYSANFHTNSLRVQIIQVVSRKTISHQHISA